MAFLALAQNAASLPPLTPPVDDEDVDDAPALDDDELELDDPPHAAATDSTAASMITHNDLRISITPLIAGTCRGKTLLHIGR